MTLSAGLQPGPKLVCHSQHLSTSPGWAGARFTLTLYVADPAGTSSSVSYPSRHSSQPVNSSLPNSGICVASPGARAGPISQRPDHSPFFPHRPKAPSLVRCHPGCCGEAAARPAQPPVSWGSQDNGDHPGPRSLSSGALGRGAGSVAAPPGQRLPRQPGPPQAPRARRRCCCRRRQWDPTPGARTVA